MQGMLVLIKVIAEVAESNGGVVRPKWVEEKIENSESLSSFGFTSYKVRSIFKEMKDDGLLAFRGNQYVWCEKHWINYVGQDIVNG